MSELDDRLIAERLAAHVPPPDGADWDDVVRRARRAGRKRIAGAVAVAIAAVALATPALGLQRIVVDWVRAEPAPEKVQLHFMRLTVGAPDEMDPAIVPGSARRVTEVQHAGKTHVLWVAPTKQGGFCWLWSNLSGSCRRDPGDGPRLGVTHLAQPDGVVEWIGGTVVGSETEQLVAEYADGERRSIPVVWVSRPIAAGFYSTWIAPEHRQRGRHLTALVAQDRAGEVLARQTFRLRRPADVERPTRLPDGELVSLPAKALVDHARLVIEFTAENGKRQWLWVMPTSEGGYCFVSNRWGGCPPKSWGQKEPLNAGVMGGGPPVLVSGQALEHVAVVELRYQDGDVERIEPVEGFLLHEIPSRHYAPGRRLELLIGYDREGHEVARLPGRWDAAGVYPCDEPVDKGYGVKVCP